MDRRREIPQSELDNYLLINSQLLGFMESKEGEKGYVMASDLGVKCDIAMLMHTKC